MEIKDLPKDPLKGLSDWDKENSQVDKVQPTSNNIHEKQTTKADSSTKDMQRLN